MKEGPEERTLVQDVPWPDEPPVMLPGQTYETVTDNIADVGVEAPHQDWAG